MTNETTNVNNMISKIKIDDIVSQDHLLFHDKNTGLAKSLKRDFLISLFISQHKSLSDKVSYSKNNDYALLPSPNRKWSKEENMLIKRIVSYIFSDFVSDEKYLNSHIKVFYKIIMRTIRDAK